MTLWAIRQLLWRLAFIVWALLYLSLATEIGVMALYVILDHPTELEAWAILAAWAAGASAGGWMLVALMKQAFPEREGTGVGGIPG